MRRSAFIAAIALTVCLCLRPAAAQPREISVLLVPGWNNIGYVGATEPVLTALAQLAGKYESVWTWDPQAQRWLGMNPLWPAAADFAELHQNQAYWVRMSATAELLMDVPPNQPAVALGPGWNNFVYPGGEGPVADALAPAAGRYSSVWQWDAGRQLWHGFTPVAPMASDFTTLGPGRPYFLRLADGPPVVLPPPAVATPVPTRAAPDIPLSVPTTAAPPLSTPSPTPGVTPLASPTLVPPATPSSVPVPMVSVIPTVSPSPPSPATPSSTPAARLSTCYSFQSYQPQLAEVGRAQSRAGFGRLTADPDFRIRDLETQPDGNGSPVLPYIPPTLLKAIGWIESGWRQASMAIARGATGPTITSSSCAYGLMQVLSGMDISGTPTPKQQKVGTDYLSNIAAGAQMLGAKWNLAPEHLPVVLPRNPQALESWYYAVWAYHCFGAVCQALGIHNHPEDPALKWPRPAYNSPDQLASGGHFTFGDYPYQELVYGVVAYPPSVDNGPLWPPLPVVLPPRGAVGFPDPRPFPAPAATFDPTVDGG